MSVLMQEMAAKALRRGVPLSVQLDLTYRCNERCVHCYLDHEDHGELTTAEIKDSLDQMAEAGVFFLTVSGGEVLMRKDFFEILEYAAKKAFCIKLKTNALLIGPKEAERIREIGVMSVQVSIYSHRPEVHDAITKVPGSLLRSIRALRLLREQGLRVIIADVLMGQTVGDYPGVRALAQELGVACTIDPTITPMMDGDRSILNLNMSPERLREVLHDQDLVGNVGEFCAPPPAPDENALDSTPCSAGHTACYVSPYGDVYPCVQFPLPTGNVRRTRFLDIWRNSPEMNEVRSITLRDLPACSTCTHIASCTRCPGLAYMEGNMRGPSLQDCQKSFARTGIPSQNLKVKTGAASSLVQIAMGGTSTTAPLRFAQTADAAR
ncbi:MAG TPA: radical SAM protein [Candidatus Acidoferrales bacterium]|nr:radical SAM protein [Candidatus Acidoferrales bacterium]